MQLNSYMVRQCNFDTFSSVIGKWKEPKQREGQVMFCAEYVAGYPVAACSLYFLGKSRDTAWIGTLWTDIDYRGRGIGGELIAAAYRWCCESGVKTAKAACIASSLGGFLRQGFEVYHEKPGGTVWMVRKPVVSIREDMCDAAG